MNVAKGIKRDVTAAFAALALIGPAQLLARPAADQPSSEPSAAAPAQQLAAKLLPPGTYEKLMGDQMADMTSTMMKSMFDDLPAMIVEMAGPEGSEERTKAQAELEAELGDRSFEEVMAEYDPYFFERLDITQRVMMSEMGKFFAGLEPEMQAALGRAIDNRYSDDQIAEALAFYSTPTGNMLAGDLYSLFMSEEMTELMMGAVPELMSAMPEIMKKAEEATAHLPPEDPCKRDPASDMCEVEEEKL